MISLLADRFCTSVVLYLISSVFAKFRIKQVRYQLILVSNKFGIKYIRYERGSNWLVFSDCSFKGSGETVNDSVGASPLSPTPAMHMLPGC